MSELRNLTFKVADQPEEFEAIHALNYRTFSEEIPQHARNESGRLVDKFHEENTYLIALREGELVGMVALRGRRPFSLDTKVIHLDALLPEGRRWCEIRLLAVEKAQRYSAVTTGLLAALAQEALRCGFDGALISGTTRQLKLYRHIGFVPVGSLVGTEEAAFQPMYLLLEAFQAQAQVLHRGDTSIVRNFLPGPVAMSLATRQAFQQDPESHRCVEFRTLVKQIKTRLCELTQAPEVQILTGSGTLANEAVAAQLSLTGEFGLIISQGEFGERLAEQARRWQCQFHHEIQAWGQALEEAALVELLHRFPQARWLWVAHGETSTGVLNHLPMLQRVCEEHQLKLCLDAISTRGGGASGLQSRLVGYGRER
jgi:N-acyl-L-homoserine lactone synthetase